MLGASLGYAAGRLNVAAGYHRINNATATDSVTNTLLSGNYNFGVLTAYLSVAKNKGTGTADSRDLVAGVAVPVGGGKLLVSHVRHDDRSLPNKDAHQWGIGYVYKLSKRTDLYTAYAAIDNENGAAFKVGNATDKGTGDRAFNLGIRHSF
jgi:predicted porin